MYTFVHADNTEKLEIHTQLIHGYEYLKLWISLRLKVQVCMHTNITFTWYKYLRPEMPRPCSDVLLSSSRMLSFSL